MANSVCKYCGEAIKWFNNGGKWVPTDPTTGQSHQSVCAAGGAGVPLAGMRGGAKLKFPFNEEAKYSILEKRVKAIEDKLGIQRPLTHNPFKKL